MIEELAIGDTKDRNRRRGAVDREVGAIGVTVGRNAGIGAHVRDVATGSVHTHLHRIRASRERDRRIGVGHDIEPGLALAEADDIRERRPLR